MKQLIVTAPAQLQASIPLPSSKSISNRALIIYALSASPYPVENLSDCDDTQVMIRALSEGKDPIDIQAAGTAMRFLTAYLSVTPGSRTLTGTSRMQQRPIQVLVDALRELGADIAYVGQEGFPPLRITGRTLTQENICLPGNVSSQYISALLMIAPTLPQGLTLTLSGTLISRPYIDLTLQLMRDFGAEAYWLNEQQLKVEPKPYQPLPFSVESDWSAASYWYQLTALAPEAEITLPGLFHQSYQGDSKGADLFRSLGVETVFETRAKEATGASQSATVILRKIPCTLKRMDYDFIDQPDLAQTFVVTCALLDLPFRFTGLQSLKIKETDRIEALIKEMRKLGYVLHETDGRTLSWDGERCEPDWKAGIDTYEDHRMAMAFAPASLRFPGLRINHPEVVSKSYPRYWDHLRQAGFLLEERTVNEPNQADKKKQP